MEIENSSIYLVATDILNNLNTSTAAGYSCGFYIEPSSKDTFEPFFEYPLTVANVNVIRDYVNNYSDTISIKVAVPLGLYFKVLYPRRNNLKVDLKRVSKSIYGDDVDGNNEVIDRYTVFMNTDKMPNNVGQGGEKISREDLDLQAVIEIEMTLISETIEKLKTLTFSSVIRQTKLDDLMETVIPNELENLNVDDKELIGSFELDTIDNEQEYEQIVLPSNTKLVDIPFILQESQGVYNTGLGSFIQEKTWFVYPLYDGSNFEETKRTITFFIVPKKKFPVIENSYVVNGDSVLVVINTDVIYQDDGGSNKLNIGNGVRFQDANSVINGNGTTEDNKYKIKREDNVNEYLVTKDADKVNNLYTPDNSITSNVAKVNSEMAGKLAGKIRLQWQNSLPEIILPAMDCKILWFENGIEKEVYGTILKAQHYSVKAGDINMALHTTTSVLDLFIQTIPKIKETSDNSDIDDSEDDVSNYSDLNE